MKRFCGYLTLAVVLCFSARGTGLFAVNDDYSSNIPQILADESLPLSVRNAFASTVAIVVLRPNALSNNFVMDSVASGFVVADHRVVTAFHVPALGKAQQGSFFYIDVPNTKIIVAYYDVVRRITISYESKIIQSSAEKDLVLLDVLDYDTTHTFKFDKKPLRISGAKISDIDPSYRNRWFSFKYVRPAVAFWRELRSFGGYFIDISLSLSPDVRGMLGVPMELGYSGAPLVHGDGHCFGMIVTMTPSESFIVPGWRIIEFLQEAGITQK
jgi:hypothetical protein